jgi:hypothetical protein
VFYSQYQSMELALLDISAATRHLNLKENSRFSSFSTGKTEICRL